MKQLKNLSVRDEWYLPENEEMGDLVFQYKFLKEDCSEVGVSLPSKQAIGQEEMALSCDRGGLDWALGKVSSEKCQALLREVVESSSLKILKKCVDVVFRDMI